MGFPRHFDGKFKKNETNTGYSVFIQKVFHLSAVRCAIYLVPFFHSVLKTSVLNLFNKNSLLSNRFSDRRIESLLGTHYGSADDEKKKMLTQNYNSNFNPADVGAHHKLYFPTFYNPTFYNPTFYNPYIFLQVYRHNRRKSVFSMLF
jgi:hypothetical protein